MNRNEGKQIIRIITAAYPVIYGNKKEDQLSDAVDVWAVALSDVPVKIVSYALYQYIRSGNQYPPTISQICDLCNGLCRQIKRNDLNGKQAWDKISYAIHSFEESRGSNYKRLPLIIKSVADQEYFYGKLKNLSIYEVDDEEQEFIKRFNDFKKGKDLLEFVDKDELSKEIKRLNEAALLEQKDEEIDYLDML